MIHCNYLFAFLLVGVLGLMISQSEQAAANDAPAGLDSCNVVWTSPSKDASGSMPIGNGEVGLNAWVEPNGDLLFYISRTDAWSECNRLLKLGRVRISLSPSPIAAGQVFRQELVLRDGQIVFHEGDTVLRLFVDAASPVIYITGECKTPRTVKATFETWRTAKRTLTGEELGSSWTMQGAPAGIDVWESADVVTRAAANQNSVLIYHRNAYSCVPFTLKHQGLGSIASTVHDPLLNRTFGACMAGLGLIADRPTGLKSPEPAKQFDITISTHSTQTDTAAAWERQLQSPASANAAVRRTSAWWHEFWNRSWILLDNNAPGVTEAYVLQRWVTACAGRGNYPIKFNGSIFTVDPKHVAGGPDYNADWRRWGDCY